MPSYTKENYLKAIYNLEESRDKISVSALSKIMRVSIPTVNNMVKRLEHEGWVVYRKYKPILLTAEGRKIAIEIIRRHRLAEMFLVKVMNLGWEQVHDIAEELEHIDSAVFFDRIDEMLEYPQTDPHGTAIPDKEGNIAKQNYLLLSGIEKGATVVLRAIKEECRDFILFLNKKEISLGIFMKVENREAFDGSLEVSFGDFQKVVLTRAVCEKLLVEKVDK